jgi:hypothetical protein
VATSILIFATVRVLKRLKVFAPLGLRFQIGFSNKSIDFEVELLGVVESAIRELVGFFADKL